MNREFKIISTPTSGKVIIKENSQFNEIQADTVIIHSNVTARLFGSVKDLNLKKDALLFIHGRILGNVINEGGEIHIFNYGK